MGRELGLGRRGCAKSLVIQGVEILAHCTRCIIGINVTSRPIVGIAGVLFLDVGADQAGIHREALTSDKPFLHAACHSCLKDMAQQIALAEATMTVLGEGGVIRHTSVRSTTAEPSPHAPKHRHIPACRSRFKLRLPVSQGGQGTVPCLPVPSSMPRPAPVRGAQHRKTGESRGPCKSQPSRQT